MYREIILLLFALAAVPLATFLWEVFKEILSGHWSATMNGFIDSWQGLAPAAIVVIVTLLLLHRNDRRSDKREEERHRELIETIKSIRKQERGEENGESKPTDTQP